MKKAQFKKLGLVSAMAATLAACGGGGGGSSTATAPVIPTPVACTAPQVLQNGACVTPVAADLTCSIPAHSYGDITYPTAYNGTSLIPTAQGKLPPSVDRAVAIKDLPIWWGRPSYVTCTDKDLYLRSVFVEDLDRIKKLGGTTVWLANNGAFVDLNATNWKMTDLSYSDSDVLMLVNEAAKRNIKVFINFGISIRDNNGKTIAADKLTALQLTTMLQAVREKLVATAIYGKQVGLMGINVEASLNEGGNLITSASMREIYVTEVARTIDAVKSVFNGSIVYGDWYSPLDSRILSKIDSLRVVMWMSSTQNLSAQFTLDDAKGLAANRVSILARRFLVETGATSTDVPIMWEVYAQSTRNFYSGMYVEDSYCTNSCEQNNVITDFSMQAVAIEGVFQTLSKQTSFKNGGVLMSNYWNNDDITPTPVNLSHNGAPNDTEFPNISSSIRNKPAEAITKAWFAK